MALSPASFEREIQRIRDALSLRETEETWDAIAAAIASLQRLVSHHADAMPSECVLALRSLGPSLNKAVTSERSRLSGAAIDLLGAAATELIDAFEALIPLFVPTLLTLCGRPNKLFVTRARNCIFTIVQATGSPNMITYFLRCCSDKSISVRLAVAESSLAWLNSVNPPELRKEARAREVEDIIKHAARDANADVRKVGRQMFEAYSLLLPHRVDGFVAPLTPTIRKFLAVSTRPSSRMQSNPPSRPSSSQSTRSATEATRATSPNPFSSSTRSETSLDPKFAKRRAPKASEPQRAGPTRSHSAMVDLVRPRTLSREVLPPQRPRSQAEIARPIDRTMPPPSIVPSRPLRAPALDSGGPSSSSASRPPTKELPRSRTGPLRPTTPQDLFAPVSTSQPPPDAHKRIVGGARRVLRTESIENPTNKQPAEEAQPESAKPAPPKVIRPTIVPPRLDAEKQEAKVTSSKGTKEPTGKKAVVAVKAETKKPLVNKSHSTATATDRLTKPTASQRAKAQSAPPVRQRTKSSVQTDRPPQRAPPANAAKVVGQLKKPRSQSERHPTPVVEPAEIPLPRTPSPTEPSPAILAPSPPATPPTAAQVSSIPPSPPSDSPPPSHAEPELIASSSSLQDSLAVPVVIVGPTTPENVTVRPRMVEQTPISALLDSIQQGFMFTPRDPNISSIAIPEVDEDAEEVAFFTGQPLVWNRKQLLSE